MALSQKEQLNLMDTYRRFYRKAGGKINQKGNFVPFKKNKKYQKNERK